LHKDPPTYRCPALGIRQGRFLLDTFFHAYHSLLDRLLGSLRPLQGRRCLALDNRYGNRILLNMAFRIHCSRRGSLLDNMGP